MKNQWELLTGDDGVSAVNAISLFQDCKAVVEEIFQVEMGNELQRDLMVRMKNNFFFKSYREKQRYESGSRFAKEPCALLQSQILIPGDLVISF